MPELSSIRTLIDLELGKLFLESPKCKDKLQISVLENWTHLSAEVDVYGQRYGHRVVCISSKYDEISFHIHLFCYLLLLSYSPYGTLHTLTERLNNSIG